ncbi:hypothetical protein CU633_21970 [Bacillus sp. V3-13]|uniref:hypothetical protein n=1 Tax=Bacillus sp. V3-13 TaxID=2053728 RepID=UPI000C77C20B|nr:hypothetical protein [Bacillus sp. V3-13]PLR75279.1 hypothetical protein CU633_21970 [Bacillus sp. V3-13]
MDKLASEKFIERDLKKVDRRIKECDWSINQKGIYVTCLFQHKETRENFSLFLSCDGYPRHPIKATFMPCSPIVYPATKWPFDGDHVFRTSSPFPFICLPGLTTYIPEKERAPHPFSLRDINIGNVITRIYQAIHTDHYNGFVTREV